jgi:hypothetical protein
MIKYVMVGIGGFGVGVAAGILIAKKKYEQQYLNLANEEISSAREYYANKTNKTCYDGAPEDASDSPTSSPEADRATLKVKPTNGQLDRSNVRENTYERAKKNYNLISKNPDPSEYDGDEGEDEDEEDDHDDDLDAAGMSAEESAAASEKGTDEPYLIESDEYSEDTLGYDKTSLYYYTVDDVLCGENGDDVIDDIEETVGYDALCKLDMQSMVWVRNERLKLDYEIISVNSSYAEAVGHMSSPRERYNKMKRRDIYEE